MIWYKSAYYASAIILLFWVLSLPFMLEAHGVQIQWDYGLYGITVTTVIQCYARRRRIGAAISKKLRGE